MTIFLLRLVELNFLFAKELNKKMASALPVGEVGGGSFGKFENVAELKAKVAENLKTEKTTEQKDKCRLAIIEKLLAETEAEIPEILTTSEEDKLLYRLEADVTQMGFKFDEYLKEFFFDFTKRNKERS